MSRGDTLDRRRLRNRVWMMWRRSVAPELVRAQWRAWRDRNVLADRARARKWHLAHRDTINARKRLAYLRTRAVGARALPRKR